MSAALIAVSWGNLVSELKSEPWLWIALGVVILVGLFVVTFFVVSLRERQHLTGDVEPASQPFPYPPSPYWQVTRDAAFQLGLQHAGDFATRQDTSVVKGLQSLFFTADHFVLASVVSASFARAKLKKTVLRTRLADGRVLESSDNPGLPDFSGYVQRALLLNAGIAELLQFHLGRIAHSGSTAVPFNPAAALAEFEKIDLDRGALWVRNGLAYWTDPSQTCIRMTFRGALASVKALLQMSGVKEQAHRSQIPRAGS